LNAPICTQYGPLPPAAVGVVALTTADFVAALAAVAAESSFDVSGLGLGFVIGDLELSVTAIAVWVLASALGSGTLACAIGSGVGFVAGVDDVALASLFGSGRVGAGAGGGDGATGAGMIVDDSFLSALGDMVAGLSLAGLSAGDGAVGVNGAAVGVNGDRVVATVRGAGGGFIQSSTYGTATAPTTPSTITTRTTRNQVAAKIERGGTSSYSSS
jgi:hypothetical protein